MNDRITYDMKRNIVNPDYIGYITKPMDEEYTFEDTNFISDEIYKISRFFSEGSEEGYHILDCTTDTTLSTIKYSQIDCPDLSMVYLFFNIICEYDTDVVFSIESIAKQRLWINEKLVALCCTDVKTKRHIFTFTLEKGNNIFCIEQHQSLKFFQTTIRVSTYDHELSTPLPSLVKNNLYFRHGEMAIVCEDTQIYNSGVLNVVCIPVDAININLNKKINVSIEDSETGESYYSDKINFFEYINIYISELKFRKKTLFSHTHFVARYYDNDDNLLQQSVDVHIIKPSGYMRHTEVRAMTLLLKPELSIEAKQYITYQLTNIYRLPEDDLRCFNSWENFAYTLNIIESGKYDNYIVAPGIKKKYYFSDMDDQLIEYQICLPENYTCTKKYSLLIFNTITSAPESRFSSLFENRPEFNDTIVVDIHGRGMTTGSYIGDTSFREILNDVLHFYSIDEDRVFMMGQSNGGYATWVLAEKTPDLFAGINPSTGHFNKDELVNLSNLRIRFLTSDADPGNKNNCSQLKKQEMFLNDYKLFVFHKLMHNVFEQIQFNTHFLRELLCAKRDKYPSEIYFNTYMNRYRKAYWIEIDSIKHGEVYANVHAKISENNIYISIQNATGFTVNVPPQASECSSVYVNGVKFPISGKSIVHFIEVVGQYIITDEVKTDTQFYKGTGLIDVYLTPMRIINCLPGDEFFDNVVKCLQAPLVNTYEGKATIEYPVYSIEFPSLNKISFLEKYSLVVVDDLLIENDFIKKVREKLEIRPYEKGFDYCGKRYECDYCIMQIIENPWNRERSILHVSTNNKKLLRDHLFLRSLILPSYASGFHPYLNVSALVFDGKKYYTVHDYGMDIVKK